MPDENEMRRVVVHTLKHYRGRLKYLVDNDPTIQFGNDVLKKDLEQNIAEADDVAQWVPTVTPSTSGAFKKTAILEPALTSYIADLKKSKDTLREKLGAAVPNLESVDHEIQMTELCKRMLV